MSLTDPALCEIMGNIGFDCVWIDTEHTYMSYKEVLCHLNAARSANISSVIRLPQNDMFSGLDFTVDQSKDIEKIVEFAKTNAI